MVAELTPWELLQTLRARGAALDELVEALQQRGLSRDDLDLLLKDAPELQPAPQRTRPALLELPKDYVAPRSRGGPSVGAWIGISLFAIVALVGAWRSEAFGPRPHPPSIPWLVLMGVALLPFAALLVNESRKGLRRTARNLGFVLFFVCMWPAIGGLGTGWGPLAVTCAVCLFASIPLVAWGSISGERLRGVASVSGGGTVYESHDVQFCVTMPDRPAPTFAPGQSLYVIVTAQSCVDAPRQLLVEVVGEPRALATACRHAFDLAPGAIVQLCIPVRVGALAPPWCNFAIDVAGRGAGGRRVRLAQGARWRSPREKSLEQVAELAELAWDLYADGASALGSFGLNQLMKESYGSFALKCDASRAVVREVFPLEARVCFAPTPAEVEAAARS